MDELQYQIQALDTRIEGLETNFLILADNISDHKLNANIHTDQWKQIDMNLKHLYDEFMALSRRVSYIEHPSP